MCTCVCMYLCMYVFVCVCICVRMYLCVSALVSEVTRLKDELQVLTHEHDGRENERVSSREKAREKEDEVEKLKMQLADAAAVV